MMTVITMIIHFFLFFLYLAQASIQILTVVSKHLQVLTVKQ